MRAVILKSRTGETVLDDEILSRTGRPVLVVEGRSWGPLEPGPSGLVAATMVRSYLEGGLTTKGKRWIKTPEGDTLARRFLAAAAGQRHEMVVIRRVGPFAYSLRLDAEDAGGADFLGVGDEESWTADGMHGPRDCILGLMVQYGADRAKAARFLLEFKRSPLPQSPVFDPQDFS